MSLEAYALREIAAIVLVHGEKQLGGYELPYDICMEIAARNRANPRQAVRCLTERLTAYFFEQSRKDGWNYEGLDPNGISIAIGQAMTLDSVCAYFDEQGIDGNGIDRPSLRLLETLADRGAMARESLMQACRMTNDRDFVIIWEYLMRLGLVEVATGGRSVTELGRTYLLNPGSLDLRDKIA